MDYREDSNHLISICKFYYNDITVRDSYLKLHTFCLFSSPARAPPHTYTYHPPLNHLKCKN